MTTTTTSITILSTSPASARRAIKILADWVPMNNLAATSFRHVIPWSLITTECADNGVQIRWLAPEYLYSSASTGAAQVSAANPTPRHSLLAITQARSEEITEGVAASGAALALTALAPFEKTLSRAALRACHFFRRPVHASHLLGSAATSRPVVQLQAQGSSDGNDAHARVPPRTRSGLKEVVIPFGDDDDHDGSTAAAAMMHQLAPLPSPATGLYLLPSSNLCVRPLPTGFHDRQMPPTSLVFHAPPQTLTWPVESRDDAVKIRKIGHSGVSKGITSTNSSSSIGGSGGQYRFISADLAGLDVRLCGSAAYQSMFAEAHESLLAGSIDKLQSTRVLGVLGSGAGGDDDADEEEDRRKTSSDCWMEFRATIRNPGGFFRKTAAAASGNRSLIAKAPDLPYE
jgi:hypothetical protein